MKNDKSIPARAESIGLSPRSLYTEIEEGRGPVITQPSKRRKIIEDRYWEEWLAGRREYPPGAAPADAPQTAPHGLPKIKSPNRKTTREAEASA